MTSLPALLAEEFLRGNTSLVVAGTHGKTTTASMVAFLLAAGERDPSFLIGGVPIDFGRSFRIGAGGLFVVEGDEYDSAFFDKRPKFVHYLPDIAIIGNVEYDHADIYPDLAAVQTAFIRLLSVIPSRGLLLAGAESPALREILPDARCRVESFGLECEADWTAVDVKSTAETWSFRLVHAGRDEGRFELALRGEHNVRNALAALAMVHAIGMPLEEARLALPGFRGVKRRLELRGNAAGVAVYDDFAHHPTAVRETLRAMRAHTGDAGRLIAVFEPRSYTSRTRVFQEDFARALSLADVVIVAAAYRSEKVAASQRISEEQLVNAIQGLGVQACFVPTPEEIIDDLAQRRRVRRGDLVVILSNGGFGAIHERLLARLLNEGKADLGACRRKD